MLWKTQAATVKEIAAGVPKSAGYDRAEREMKEAVAAHEAAVEETRAAIVLNGDQKNSEEVRRRVAIELAADKALRAVREKYMPLRAEHGAKVAAALRPIREAAAARILELLADFSPEIKTLSESMFAIEAFGVECVRVPPLHLEDAEYVARRIAGSSATAVDE